MPSEIPATHPRRRLLLFVDLETGGLIPGFHEIIQLGYILTDPSGRQVLASASEKAMPLHPERIQPEARAVNGFDEASWVGAPTLRDALQRMADTIAVNLGPNDDVLFVAHNTPFDIPRIQEACREQGVTLPGREYHSIDTASLAWPLVERGVLPRQRLEALVDYFGLQSEHPHDALSDAEDCRQVYIRLVELSQPLWLRARTALVGVLRGEQHPHLLRHSRPPKPTTSAATPSARSVARHLRSGHQGPGH